MITDDGILEKIGAAIEEETSTPANTITTASSAASVQGWDSLAHTRIVMNVEMRLGVMLDMDETYKAANVGDLVSLVRKAIVAGS